jgi:hypothetical protein
MAHDCEPAVTPQRSPRRPEPSWLSRRCLVYLAHLRLSLPAGSTRCSAYPQFSVSILPSALGASGIPSARGRQSPAHHIHIDHLRGSRISSRRWITKCDPCVAALAAAYTGRGHGCDPDWNFYRTVRRHQKFMDLTNIAHGDTHVPKKDPETYGNGKLLLRTLLLPPVEEPPNSLLPPIQALLKEGDRTGPQRASPAAFAQTIPSNRSPFQTVHSGRQQLSLGA